jgi:hypothetical protein
MIIYVNNVLLQVAVKDDGQNLLVLGLGAVEPGDGVLHPLLVVAVREVLPRVRAPALLHDAGSQATSGGCGTDGCGTRNVLCKALPDARGRACHRCAAVRLHQLDSMLTPARKRVSKTRLAGLGRVHGDGGVRQQVVQLARLSQVRVPHQAAVLQLHDRKDRQFRSDFD